MFVPTPSEDGVLEYGPVIMTDEEVHILDPRGVITDLTDRGSFKYWPRMPDIHDLPKWVTDWLFLNPEWPIFRDVPGTNRARLYGKPGHKWKDLNYDS
jgi:hypothetical protein